VETPYGFESRLGHSSIKKETIMAKYRKKPVVIDAVQLTWANWSDVCELANVGDLRENQPTGCYIDENGDATEAMTDTMGLAIPTLEGVMLAREGDWIIKGVAGEIYPCKPEIFEQTYEEEENGLQDGDK
jgi:hypothetical protein